MLKLYSAEVAGCCAMRIYTGYLDLEDTDKTSYSVNIVCMDKADLKHTEWCKEYGFPEPIEIEGQYFHIFGTNDLKKLKYAEVIKKHKELQRAKRRKMWTFKAGDKVILSYFSTFNENKPHIVFIGSNSADHPEGKVDIILNGSGFHNHRWLKSIVPNDNVYRVE